jgi:hypothetical protein
VGDWKLSKVVGCIVAIVGAANGPVAVTYLFIYLLFNTRKEKKNEKKK